MPDATTPPRLRRLLEENSLQETMLSPVDARLDRAGPLMHGGSTVDAPVIQAPSSTKNAKGERDPETRQARKGGQRHFGMKVHAAVDAGTGYAVAATFTPANARDMRGLHNLVREGGSRVFADSGCRGCAKRPEISSDPRLSAVDWKVCATSSKKRELKGADREEERRTPSVRVRAGHLFALPKSAFGYSKARCRGTARNAARIWALPASANPPRCARAGRQGEFLAAWAAETAPRVRPGTPLPGPKRPRAAARGTGRSKNGARPLPRAEIGKGRAHGSICSALP